MSLWQWYVKWPTAKQSKVGTMFIRIILLVLIKIPSGGVYFDPNNLKAINCQVEKIRLSRTEQGRGPVLLQSER